jgi:D-lactate dehydrogenase
MNAADPARLVSTLRDIVGRPHVLTEETETRRFRSGYRTGEGPVIAVVRPGSLIEQWRIVQACVAADVSIILQASNTGLTGGSTPDGAGYPGGVVLVSTTRIAGVHVIDGGNQVVCLPGATLYELERTLKPYAREPHSVIGSSCIGASVLGGICNNSGGSLVQRGPAFTQLALYAAVRTDGTVELVNHLGITIAGAPEDVLAAVEQGTFDPAAIAHDPACWAHDRAYADHVRQIDADTPARFNADPRCLFEGSGSAGKVVLFAVRLDTFPRQEGTATFYIGTNDPMQLTHLRREILGGFDSLPIAGEYIHRTAFDIAAVYGKDTFLAIQRLGTDRLPSLFALKAKVDALVGRLRIFGDHVSDHAMQFASKLFPHHLPKRMRDYRDRYEHHLMLKMPAATIDRARALLTQTFASGDGAFFECTAEEATKAFLHRFATAGAAIRYREIHHREVEDILALDIALPRNERDWLETLPPRSRAASSTNSITATSSATSSIRIISCGRASIRSRWSIGCGSARPARRRISGRA